jgi:hypothetical protein
LAGGLGTKGGVNPLSAILGGGGADLKAQKNNPANAFEMAKTAEIPAPTTGPAPVTLGSVQQGEAGQVNTGSTADPALMANLAQLQQMASGQGPSVAGMQLQQGREANIAATMAQAASQRGGFNPMLARQALQSGAAQNARANTEAAQARLQEQMAAVGALSQQGTTMRGQDIGAATQQAQMETQASLANAANDLQKQVAQGQITADQAQQLFAAQQNAAIATAELRQKYMAMGYDVQKANQMADAEIQKAKAGASASGLGAVLGAGGAIVGGLLASKGGSSAAPAAAPVKTAARGGMVPGKAAKDGDHPDNDTVPARLSPGEFVLPRSLTSDKELMSMVHQKMAEHQVQKSTVTASEGFADVLKAHAELNAKMDALKKYMGGS